MSATFLGWASDTAIGLRSALSNLAIHTLPASSMPTYSPVASNAKPSPATRVPVKAAESSTTPSVLYFTRKDRAPSSASGRVVEWTTANTAGRLGSSRT